MPRLTTNLKRADSDSLARLCKRYGHIALAAIEAGKAGIRRGALKAKLIAYYHNLEGEWSREREKEDWEGHDLATLKYETSRLLIKILAKNAPVDSQDLYTEIAEINWAIENGAYQIALNISRTAQAFASAREQYGVLYELLESEERILELLNKDGTMDESLLDCAVRQNECFLQFSLTHECVKIRKGFYEPIKKIREAGTVVPVTLIEGLNSALNQIKSDQLLGTAARVDFFSCSTLCNLLSSDLDAAILNTEALLATYAESQWYADKHTIRYITQLRAASLLYSKTGRYEAAEQIIRSFQKLKKRYPEFELELNYSQFFCGITLGQCSNQNSYSAHFISDLLEKGEVFEGQIRDKDWLRLYWRGLASCLHFEQFQYAYRLGRQIVNFKSNAKRNILIAARIALFACETLLFSDDENLISYSFIATDNFLKRNGTDYPTCRAILKSIRTTWALSKSKAGRQRLAKAKRLDVPLQLIDASGNLYFDFEPLAKKVKSSLLNVVDNGIDDIASSDTHPV